MATIYRKTERGQVSYWIALDNKIERVLAELALRWVAAGAARLVIAS